MIKNVGATVFPLLILGLLAGLTFWLEQTANFDDLQSRAKLRHDPDFRIENFEVRHFDGEGDIKQALSAKSMLHFPDDESSELTAPTLIYYNGKEPTIVSSRRAWLDHDGKEVRLFDSVRLIHKGAPGDPDTVVETSRLTVFPDDQLARNSVPVTIRQGQSTVSGTGLDYDGKRHIAVLKGRAKGTFYRNEAH